MIKRILVLGQTPSQFGVQALILQSLLEIKFYNIQLFNHGDYAKK